MPGGDGHNTSTAFATCTAGAAIADMVLVPGWVWAGSSLQPWVRPAAALAYDDSNARRDYFRSLDEPFTPSRRLVGNGYEPHMDEEAGRLLYEAPVDSGVTDMDFSVIVRSVLHPTPEELRCSIGTVDHEHDIGSFVAHAIARHAQG